MAAAVWHGDGFAGAPVLQAGYPSEWTDAAAAATNLSLQRQNAAAAPPGWFGSPQPALAPPGSFSSGAQVAPLGQNRFQGQFMPHRMCNHFAGHGWCRKEEQCTFAHGLHELHPEVAAKLAPQKGSALAALEAKGAALLAAQAQAQAQRTRFVQEHSEEADDRGLPNGIHSATASLGATAATSSLSQGFRFNLDAAPFVTKFNVDAAPFVPILAKAEVVASDGVASSVDKDNKSAGAAAGPGRIIEPITMPGETLNATSSFTAATSSLIVPSSIEASAPSPALPGVMRRQAPSPLAMNEMPRHAATASLGSTVLRSPTAAASSPVAARILVGAASPRMSPKAAASPTSSFFGNVSGAFSMKQASPASPTSRQSSKESTGEATAGSTNQGTSVVLEATRGKVATPSVALLDRQTLLQARNVAKRLEQGPPGLGTYAPTPTSAARGFGFQFPQPGYISARPVSSNKSLPRTERAHHRVAKA